MDLQLFHGIVSPLLYSAFAEAISLFPLQSMEINPILLSDYQKAGSEQIQVEISVFPKAIFAVLSDFLVPYLAPIHVIVISRLDTLNTKIFYMKRVVQYVPEPSLDFTLIIKKCDIRLPVKDTEGIAFLKRQTPDYIKELWQDKIKEVFVFIMYRKYKRCRFKIYLV